MSKTIDQLPAVTSIADADEVMDWTTNAGTTNKITWANMKANLKTYFDALYTLANLGGVATTRQVNGHALSADVTVTNADLGAVPTSRTVNGHALSADVTVTNADLGAVPTTRQINSKALSADVTLSTADIADSTDKRYCTDAQKVVIGNTSNTNTGDQTISDATISTTDITTNNSSSTKHGFLKKLSNAATDFMNGAGNWVNPLTAAIFTSTAAYTAFIDNGNSGTSKTIDWTQGNLQKITTTGSCTLTFTAPTNPCTLHLKIIHEASSTAYTYTWPSVKWPGGVAATTTNTTGAVDYVTLVYDGTNYYGVGNAAFA